MMQLKQWAAFAAAACALVLAPNRAGAHGFVGDRFFPATTATDDPFAVDELAFPTISWIKNAAGEGPSNREIDYGFEFDKEIFPHFAMGVSNTYITQKPRGGRTITGWDNLTVTAKYEAWQSDAHEAIVSVGLEADIGGTGSKSVGRESFTTFTPTVYFGKGFGDLPEAADPLRPFAVTGAVGQSIPMSSKNPNTLEWGFALEYSLPYLHQHVQDIGLPHPLRDLIPLVEFAFETAENRDEGGLTTGTINPGILWETKWFQLGVEANIPINSESGAHVGATVQMWIYIDDLFPKAFGHPIFGAR